MKTAARRTAAIAAVGLVVLMGLASPGWATAPHISKFAPTSGTVGTSIAITGTGFIGVRFVRFNGHNGTFSVNSSTKVTAKVPGSATTGKISVVTTGGAATSTGTFKVLPSISSFTPSSGIIGSTVTIIGGGFGGTTSVTFGGVSAVFTVHSTTNITATIPAGASTGTIAVTTPAGTATTGSSFKVLPNIISFSPTAGAIGSTVVITGTAFVGVTGVTFNGVAAANVVNSSTQITATVPLTTTGPIAVTTVSGTAMSATNFVILASISLSASSGPPTSAITVSGTGFTAGSAEDVYFDGTEVAVAGNDQSGTFTGVPFTVPASAVPGTHYVSAVERIDGKWAQTTFDVNTDWSMFRNTPSHRGNNPYENVVGTQNVGNLFQAWSATTNGVPTSPAIVGGTIYVGSSNFSLYAFNASTGVQDWAFPTTAAITSSPAVAGGIVYVASSDGKLWAVNATTGLAAWGGPVTLSGATSSSPTVSGGIVYIGTSTGNMYAIDAATGAVDWTAAPGGGVAGSPAVANGDVVFATTTGRVVAFNATSGGGQLWNVTPGGALTTPLISNGVVYVGSGNTNIYALSLASGATYWSNTPGCGMASAPAFANGLIYIGCNDGNVYAWDTAGNNPWTNGNGTAYQSPIAVANGVVYAGSNDDAVYAFDAASGTMLWSALTNGQVKAGPVLVNGTLYVASNDGHVYAYTLSTQGASIRRPQRRDLHASLGT